MSKQKKSINLVLLVFCLCLNLANAKKMALVIGNNDYRAEIGVLVNPINDAKDIATVLKEDLGFEVTTLTDIETRADFQRAVADFGRRLSPDDIAFFYYSGHGIQVNNINYLIPTQASITSPIVLKNDSITVSYVLEEIQYSGSRTNILVIDACRNLPGLGGTREVNRGLAEMNKISDSLIAFATAPGETALDGLPGERNSPYVTRLKTFLQDTSLDVENVFISVRDQVYNDTNGQQRPQLISDLSERVYLGEQTAKAAIQKQALGINSNPEGASVSLNGEVIGKTPIETELGAGSYQVEISLIGYETYKEDIALIPNKGIGAIKSIEANLTPLSTGGKALITSEPSGAGVFLNSGFAGATPLELEEEFGDYDITLSLRGYEEYQTKVTITEAEISNVHAKLERVKGTLNISSEPAGAEIFVNDEKMGVTPLEELAYAEGIYNIRLSLAGFADYTKQITVVSGESIDLSTELEELLAVLEIQSEPSKAGVIVNGGFLGTTPLQLERKAGEYEVKLILEGYQDYLETVTLGAGEEFTVDAELLERSQQVTAISEDAATNEQEEPLLPAEAPPEVSAQSEEETVIDANDAVVVKPVGEEPVVEPLRIEAAAESNLAVKEMGFLSVTSGPIGAKVFVDGDLVGVTPVERRELGVGDYQVRVELEGHKVFEQSVRVRLGEVGSVFVGLQSLLGYQPVNQNADWTPVKKYFDGVKMVLVPAGSFEMGDNNGDNDEKPVHIQRFDKPFWIDEIEVTRGAYEACVSTELCTSTPDNNFSNRANQPINGVTWYQATAYCEWRGARLPTEAEWEYAARGPDSLVYTWGNEFDRNKVQGFHNSNRRAANVGSYPSGASWVGALDMSGNVWEWTQSLYKDYSYNESVSRNLSGNEKDISENITLRGGSFGDTADRLRTANRNRDDASVVIFNIGFRCVHSNSAS